LAAPNWILTTLDTPAKILSELVFAGNVSRLPARRTFWALRPSTRDETGKMLLAKEWNALVFEIVQGVARWLVAAFFTTCARVRNSIGLRMEKESPNAIFARFSFGIVPKSSRGEKRYKEKEESIERPEWIDRAKPDHSKKQNNFVGLSSSIPVGAMGGLDHIWPEGARATFDRPQQKSPSQKTYVQTGICHVLAMKRNWMSEIISSEESNNWMAATVLPL